MGIAPVNAWFRDFTGRGEVYAQGNSFCITVGSHYGLAGIRSGAVSIVGISSEFQSIPNRRGSTSTSDVPLGLLLQAHLYKEHREGKKGEKILVPVHFFWREDSKH